ncbi:hypothetical protein [Streptomyces sp. NPDC002671]
MPFDPGAQFRTPVEKVRLRPRPPAAYWPPCPRQRPRRSSNSSKSDSGPADWKPTNHAIWCTYAKDHTHIKSVWKLTTTDNEKSTLSAMLDTCTN